MSPAAHTQPHATCPVHAAPAALAPESQLVLPLHQRIVTQRHPMADGAVELRLYHGDKEVSFDEPALFAFGETLARQSSFEAGAATAWGAGHEWPQVRDLLQQLLDAGVLQRAEEAAPQPARPSGGDRPAPLPSGPNTRPRSWFDCASLSAELTGRPLEMGWLELVLPIFRVAHMALDEDGRQVGESNVFPPALRLDIPTRWRTCIYPGTRFQPERPMNVTALKAMRQHWGPMMATLQQVRRAYLERYPDARAGWTVGHLERLATTVLALATYPLMRVDSPVSTLHPALSSLFRVTDGLRMVMHQMLFIPIGEPTLSPDAPMTSAQVLAYAERNHSFHSEHGVCAGPQAMVEEFLAVLVDGHSVDHTGPLPQAVQQALDDLPAAIDYALLGLQAYAAVFSLWPAMTRCYERLAAAAEDAGGTAWTALRERLQAHAQSVHRGTFLAHESWRVDREQVYADMYARCGQGLGQHVDVHTLPQALQPTVHRGLAERIAAQLRLRLGDAEPQARAALCGALVDFILRGQAVLRLATAVQARINTLLGRPAPTRPFDSADIDIHNQLQGALSRRLPYLLDELEPLFGMAVTLDADAIHIHTRDDGPPRAPHSAGMGLAETRALGT